MKTIRTKGWTLGVSLALAAMGCSEAADEGEPTGAELPEVGQMAEALVTADRGGEMRLADFRLEVPAGAVRQDVRLMMEVASKEGKPERDTLRGPVYELGPDGTRFDRPVALELPVERLPRDDERAEVVWLDETRDRWVPLPGAEVVEGKVRGRADHFTAFAVRFVEKQGGATVEGSLMCEGAFEPCGGELLGTWDFTDACTTGDPLGFDGMSSEAPSAEGTDEPSSDDGSVTFVADAGSDPLDGGARSASRSSESVAVQKQSDPCAEDASDFTIAVEGSVTFAQDGTVSGSQTVMISGESRLPVTCFEPATCEEAGAVRDGEDCVYTFSDPGTAQDLGGTYSTSGGVLNVVDAQADSPQTDRLEYCVQGGQLTVVSRDPETGTEFRFTATRR